MLSKLKQRKEEKGFTIIEVMIVLAIAGLIMVVVFLAVPALQRSQRNSARDSEASRYGAAVQDFVANNNGTAPASFGDVNSVNSSFGTFQSFSGMTSPNTAATATTIVVGKVGYISGAITTAIPATAITADGMVVNVGAKCGTPGTSTTTTAGTAGRSIALLYTRESGSGNMVISCNQIN